MSEVKNKSAYYSQHMDTNIKNIKIDRIGRLKIVILDGSSYFMIVH